MEVITGPQLRATRLSLNWEAEKLAVRPKVPVGVIQRAEDSPSEPVVTIAQLNAPVKALRSAEASSSPFPNSDADQP